MLTKAEQAQERFDLALKSHGKKIHTYSRNSFYQVPGYTLEDMEQELLAVLFIAVQAYDPVRGSFFNSFLQQCLRNHIGKLKTHANTAKRQAEVISLDIEAVQAAVDNRRSLPSAEDQIIERESFREAYEEASPRYRRRFEREFEAS